jgi:hypothetical protein
LRIKEKFDGDFKLKGRFDSEKTRAHYVFMPFATRVIGCGTKRVVEGSNVTIPEVVVENGYRKEDALSFDGVGGDEQQCRVDVDATPINMVLDSQLTHEALQSSPMAVDEPVFPIHLSV